MTTTAIKTFPNSTFDSIYNGLKTSRIATELKTLQKAAKRSTVVKTLLAIATLATAVTLVALYHASTFMLGLGIGILTLSTYALYHCRHQHKHTTRLFKTATQALAEKR
jgi:hypothetical protein